MRNAKLGCLRSPARLGTLAIEFFGLRWLLESGWLVALLASACVLGPNENYRPPSDDVLASDPPIRLSEVGENETRTGDDSETGSIAFDTTSTSSDDGTSSSSTSFDVTSSVLPPVTSESGGSGDELGEVETEAEAGVDATTDDIPTTDVPPECDLATYDASDFSDPAALDGWEPFGEQGGPMLRRGALAFPFHSGIQRQLPWYDGEPVMTRFVMHEAPSASATFFLKLTFTNQCYVSLVLSHGDLVPEDNGFQREGIPFSLERHRWLRLVAAPGGRVEWSASPDGASWSTFANLPSCATAPTPGGVKLEFNHSANGSQDRPIVVDFVDHCSPL